MTSTNGYQVLYTKYRPKSFSEVIGQKHVVEPIVNAYERSTLPHSFVMSGTRGTGKTTIARLVAAMLNCVGKDRTGADPCGECYVCSGIFSGTYAAGVYEYDAATKSGKDDIRALIDDMTTATAADFKIYIIDECHMLSAAANNALLKTIEEPPPNVFIVFATTEIQKVLPTIKSRSLTLNFTDIDSETLMGHVEMICEKEGFDLSQEILQDVVREGRGSVRDTLSALERVSLGGEVASGEGLDEVLRAVADRKAPDLIAALATSFEGGTTALNLLDALTKEVRNLILVLKAPAHAYVPEHLDKKIKALATDLGMRRLARLISTLGKARGQVQSGVDGALAIEIALLTSIDKEFVADLDDTLDLLEELMDVNEELVRSVATLNQKVDSLIEGSPESKKAKKDTRATVESPRGSVTLKKSYEDLPPVAEPEDEDPWSDEEPDHSNEEPTTGIDLDLLAHELEKENTSEGFESREQDDQESSVLEIDPSQDHDEHGNEHEPTDDSESSPVETVVSVDDREPSTEELEELLDDVFDRITSPAILKVLQKSKVTHRDGKIYLSNSLDLSDKQFDKVAAVVNEISRFELDDEEEE